MAKLIFLIFIAFSAFPPFLNAQSAPEFAETLKLAKQGDSASQYNLGRMYYEGIRTQKDVTKAIEWYTKSAENGDSDAQHNLGVIFYEMKNYKNALKYFLDAANLGNPDSQNNLGYMYKNGIGVEKNLHQARKYFVLSSKKNNFEASENLKLMNDLDAAKAEANQDAMFAYQEETYKKDILSKAQNGDKLSQYFMGYGYFYGIDQKKDYVQALYWFKKSAEQNLGGSQYYLGLIYEEGRGTPKNDEISFYWYQKSAAQNFYPAQTKLSSKYYLGEGINKDLILSYAWANIAASNNEIEADQTEAEFRNLIGEMLTRTELAEAQRISAKWKPGQNLARE